MCEKCKNYEKEIQGCLYMDADCVSGEMFESFTNYDRIRNMSVDEMAEIIQDIYSQGYVDCLHDEGCAEIIDIEQWLLQEAVSK